MPKRPPLLRRLRDVRVTDGAGYIYNMVQAAADYIEDLEEQVEYWRNYDPERHA